ncbi:MAG: histone deacetylase [Proteobacteria bacterium]|nr:histone deacetylase [Pseudomonadota bacterium]
MRVHFHDDYVVDLPAGHAFPMRKFVHLRDILLREGLVRAQDVVAPPEAPWELLRLAHSEDYLSKLRDGTLDAAEVRRLGLPWSPALVRRSRRATMGTLMAARAALADGIAANLAGGTHHACHDHGEGYCVINDVVVAVRALAAEGAAHRALVVDLDVHHGNGNAELLARDPGAFTFSMHGERNYPLRKPPSDLDVGLPDGTGDDAYLQALETHLPMAFERSRPELVFYLAGVDVVAGDRFGRLSLTRAGLARRDRFVLEQVRAHGVPVVLVLAGGYAPTPEATADLHAMVHREAAALGMA